MNKNLGCTIAVGVICGLIGVVYGAARGISITNKIWARGMKPDFSEVDNEQE